jgi:Na+/H+-dicarboxylate symporter
MAIWKKILIGMTLGILVGILFNENKEIFDYFKPFGDIFIKLLKVMAIPLVFTSIVGGITSLADPSALGRMSFKAITMYMATTLMAIIIGLFFAFQLEPGKLDDDSIKEVAQSETTIKAQQDYAAIFSDIFPENLFQALSEGKVLQVIVFAVIFSFALNLTPKGEQIIRFNNNLIATFENFVHIVIKFAPFGVFCLLAYVIGNQGTDVILNLGKFAMTFIIAALLHVIIVYGFILKSFTKISVKHFFKHAVEAQVMGFSTSSSSATLPVTMECAKDMGISEKVRGLVVPLGSTVNMDGSALYQGICVVFVAQLYGIDLTNAQILTVVLTAVLSSVGTAGVPGVSLVTLSIIFDAVGLPMEGIAIIFGIDRILDMMRTTVNITGDLVVSAAVDEGEKKAEAKRVKKFGEKRKKVAAKKKTTPKKRKPATKK